MPLSRQDSSADRRDCAMTYRIIFTLTSFRFFLRNQKPEVCKIKKALTIVCEYWHQRQLDKMTFQKKVQIEKTPL